MCSSDLGGPPKVVKKSKESIAKAAAGGSKAKKKKWNSGKTKEKVNNAVYFDEATYEKLLQEVPHTRLITVSTLADKLRINGSVARAAIKDLEAKGLIKKVSTNSSQLIYTNIERPKGEKKEGEKKEAPAKQGGGGTKKQPAKKEAPAKGAAAAKGGKGKGKAAPAADA